MQRGSASIVVHYRHATKFQDLQELIVRACSQYSLQQLTIVVEKDYSPTVTYLEQANGVLQANLKIHSGVVCRLVSIPCDVPVSVGEILTWSDCGFAVEITTGTQSGAGSSSSMMQTLQLCEKLSREGAYVSLVMPHDGGPRILQLVRAFMDARAVSEMHLPLALSGAVANTVALAEFFAEAAVLLGPLAHQSEPWRTIMGSIRGDERSYVLETVGRHGWRRHRSRPPDIERARQARCLGCRLKRVCGGVDSAVATSIWSNKVAHCRYTAELFELDCMMRRAMMDAIAKHAEMNALYVPLELAEDATRTSIVGR